GTGDLHYTGLGFVTMGAAPAIVVGTLQLQGGAQHFRGRQRRPELATQETEWLVADAGHRRQHHVRSQSVGADLQHGRRGKKSGKNRRSWYLGWPRQSRPAAVSTAAGL